MLALAFIAAALVRPGDVWAGHRVVTVRHAGGRVRIVTTRPVLDRDGRDRVTVWRRVGR